MRVIKSVLERHGKLVSTYAKDEWKCEYKKGVVTKPKIGYLFAFPEDISKADLNACTPEAHYWWAEAEVVGRLDYFAVEIRRSNLWSAFWENPRLLPVSYDATFMLCSSITLLEEIISEEVTNGQKE